MSTHTPGPWRLWLSDEPRDRGAFVLHGDSPEPHGKNLLIVQRNIGTPNGDEGVANARLISAAPELLSALKEYVEWFGAVHGAECPADDTCDCIGGALNARVNAAIAKAEGR